MSNVMRIWRTLLVGWFVCVSVVFAVLSCGSTSKANNVSKQDKDSSIVVESSKGVYIDVSDSLFASLRRGFCFGRCPVYTVNIYQSGYATYSGEANVEKIGEFVGSFSGDQLEYLKKLAIEIDYFSFDTLYNEPKIADLPAISTSIVLDGLRKKVVRKINFPQNLERFELTIDSLVSSIAWKQK